LLNFLLSVGWIPRAGARARVQGEGAGRYDFVYRAAYPRPRVVIFKLERCTSQRMWFSGLGSCKMFMQTRYKFHPSRMRCSTPLDLILQARKYESIHFSLNKLKEPSQYMPGAPWFQQLRLTGLHSPRPH
jgi:hypothetical protein